MQNSTLKASLLLAVLSLLVAGLLVETLGIFHLLPYRTVVHENSTTTTVAVST